MRLVVAVAVALFIAAHPAEAGPVVAAFGAIKGALAPLMSTAIGKFVVQFAVSQALGALARALAPKPQRARTEASVQGDLSPERIIMGRYATRGSYCHPLYVNGDYAHLVVTICAMPGVTLDRVAVQGEWVTLDTASPHADYGYPATGKYAGALWVKWYDGTQTATDPYMLATFGSDSVAPWTSDMIGDDIVYAIVTVRKGLSPEVWSGLPQPIFEVIGIPNYDPRQDSTAGGSGTQRWDDPSTWWATANPAVLAYNILRGITLPGGDTWGGRYDEADLPYSSWAAAMDICDELVSDGSGGSKARYLAGIAFGVDEEPAVVLDELAKAMGGQIVPLPDGRVITPAGGPALPVAHVDDDQDTLTSEPVTARPHPPSSERWTGVTATYVSRDELWQPRESDPVMSATLPDLGGRRVADVRLEAVWDGEQAGRLASAWIADHELQARHTLPLPPALGLFDPLDTVTVTSDRYGYSVQEFEVAAVLEDVRTGRQTITIRQVDSSVWS